MGRRGGGEGSAPDGASRVASAPGDDSTTDATNIASALKLSQASFPEDSAKRIVIVTDGNENLGDAKSVARSLADAGIGIDVVPIFVDSQAEVAVEKIALPPDIRRETVRKGKEPRSHTVMSFFADTGLDELEMHRARAEMVDPDLLVEAVADHVDSLRRNAAMDALAKGGARSVPALVRGLRHPDGEVVMFSAGVLAPPWAASALSNCFRSKWRSFSRSASSAARVLAEIGLRFFAARRFVGTAEL